YGSDPAVQTNDDAQQHRRLEVRGTDEDGSHRSICRLKANGISLRVVVLDGRFFTDERHDYLPPIRRCLLPNEDVVAAEDTCLDHRIALHAQSKHRTYTSARLSHERGIDPHGIDDVLLGQQG